MDADTFHRLVARTRMHGASRRMARRVLVDGVSASQAAREEGLTRQRAHQSAMRVLHELRSEGGYPPDWTALTVVVPEDAALEILELVRRYHRAAGLRVD